MPDKYYDKAADPANAPPADEPEKEVPQPEPWRDELANLSGKIEQLTLQMGTFGQQQAPAPAPPRGPSVEEQISKLDAELVKLDTALDEAIAEGRGIAAISRKRDEITQRKYDLKYDAKLQEIQTMGTYAIDQLADEVVKGKMPMLEIPEVKKAYDDAVNQMTPDQRMNPRVRQTAYDYACGANMNLIIDKKIEERIRKEAETPEPQTPVGKSGRDVSEKDDPNRIPDPSEYLSAENLAALDESGQTVDQYYKKQGYAGGWEEFWVKTGKAYFTGEEEEDEGSA